MSRWTLSLSRWPNSWGFPRRSVIGNGMRENSKTQSTITLALKRSSNCATIKEPMMASGWEAATLTKRRAVQGFEALVQRPLLAFT